MYNKTIKSAKIIGTSLLLIIFISPSISSQNIYKNNVLLTKIGNNKNIPADMYSSYEKGKFHVVTFSLQLSSCPPCEKEIIRLSEFMKDNENMSSDYSVIVGSNSSYSSLTVNELNEWKKKLQWKFPIYFDENRILSEELELGVKYPITIITDQNGNIVYNKAGLKEDKEITVIKNKLKELHRNKVNASDNITIKKEPETLFIPYSKNKEYLSSEIKSILDGIIPITNKYNSLEFKIGIFAESDNNYISNKTFSQRRADEIKKYMISKKISSDRIIESIGLGEDSFENINTEYDNEKKRNMIIIKIFKNPFFTIKELEDLSKNKLIDVEEIIKANEFKIDEISEKFVRYKNDEGYDVKYLKKYKTVPALSYRFESLYAFNSYKSELINLKYSYLGQKSIEGTDYYEYYKNDNFSFKLTVVKHNDGTTAYMVLVEFLNV